MSIVSLSFFIFVSILALIYFIIPKKFLWVILLVASYIFYIIASNSLATYLVLTTITTFLCGIYLQKKNDAIKEYKDKQHSKKNNDNNETINYSNQIKQLKLNKKIIFILTLFLNFGLLFLFKYLEVIINRLEFIFDIEFIIQDSFFLNFILPLGISFYTFQSVGYLVDVYRGKVHADKDIFKFALFLSFFPQVIQGPINRYAQMSEQLYTPHSFDFLRVKHAILRILWGLFKKLVISNQIALFVNPLLENYATLQINGLETFFIIFCCGLMIYTDFSGGIDIVIGVAEIFDIKMMENFRQPYFATSIRDYWQRWHISLSTWMRDYVFYSLILSKFFSKITKSLRKHKKKFLAKHLSIVVSTFVIFVLIGIWHGPNLIFIAYGLYQGVFVALSSVMQNRYNIWKEKLHIDGDTVAYKFYSIIRTIILVTFGNYFVNSINLTMAFSLLFNTFTCWDFNGFTNIFSTEYALSIPQYIELLLSVILLFVVDALHEKNISITEVINRHNIIVRWSIYYLIIFSIIIFGIYGEQLSSASFVYQGF